MAVSKSRRFEVFKRDGFTCQYCGVQPNPENSVVLEVDHIDPRAHGGSDDELNLITACSNCNRGKRDKQLGDVHPRPDADLAYLEVQQEIAEAQRYMDSLVQREQMTSGIVQGIQQVWCSLMDSDFEWMPSDSIVRQFLNRYAPETVEAAIRDIAPKVESGYVAKSSWNRYAWAVMRRLDATQPDPMLCSECGQNERCDICVGCVDEIIDKFWEQEVREVTHIVPR